jgi:hypothetical protein
MHHLKHIRTINIKLSTFDQNLAKMNRKQIPLCKECHIAVHKGEYKGIPLGYLKSKGKKTTKTFPLVLTSGQQKETLKKTVNNK